MHCATNVLVVYLKLFGLVVRCAILTLVFVTY
nr:MAG TPA: hypothetical protein [Caudoviricetes sp.]